MEMEYLLPSQISRLVYGYLLSENCIEAAEYFLSSSPRLIECLKVKNDNCQFRTDTDGFSLLQVFGQYRELCNAIKKIATDTFGSDVRTNTLNDITILLRLVLNKITKLKGFSCRSASTQTEFPSQSPTKEWDLVNVNKPVHTENHSFVHTTDGRFGQSGVCMAPYKQAEEACSPYSVDKNTDVHYFKQVITKLESSCAVFKENDRAKSTVHTKSRNNFYSDKSSSSTKEAFKKTINDKLKNKPIYHGIEFPSLAKSNACSENVSKNNLPITVNKKMNKGLVPVDGKHSVSSLTNKQIVAVTDLKRSNESKFTKIEHLRKETKHTSNNQKQNTVCVSLQDNEINGIYRVAIYEKHSCLLRSNSENDFTVSSQSSGKRKCSIEGKGKNESVHVDNFGESSIKRLKSITNCKTNKQLLCDRMELKCDHNIKQQSPKVKVSKINDRQTSQLETEYHSLDSESNTNDTDTDVVHKTEDSYEEFTVVLQQSEEMCLFEKESTVL